MEVEVEVEVEGVQMGDNHANQDVLEGMTYNLWEIKEPDYVMRMMQTDGQLGYQVSSKSKHRWNNGGVGVQGTEHRLSIPVVVDTPIRLAFQVPACCG
jgi:hypothetical protein